MTSDLSAVSRGVVGLFIILVVMIPGHSLCADLSSARNALDARNYPTAIAQYVELLDRHGHQTDLYYNLGLAYAGAEDWPAAVLCLERSLALAPGEDDAEEHLEFARERLQAHLLSSSTERSLTQGEPSELVWWRFFHSTSSTVPTALLLLAWALAFLSLIVRRFLSHPGVRDTLMVLAVCGLLVSVGSAAYLVGSWQTDDVRPAIIVGVEPRLFESPTQLAVTSTPDDLYPGALVQVRAAREQWRQIELSDGTRGWIPRSSIEEVRVNRWE